ncbi:MAG: acyl-ACP--UDP-N-acetylglucosamine O-acyltransferase [Verrucomicrobiota bacterium]
MANEIHPTAIIDSGAELGDDLVIGPYCVVNAGVRLGSGCQLSNHVTLDGPTEIGEGNHFYSYSSIGQRTQDLKYDGEPTYLKIGAGNTFREFCTVNRSTSVDDATIIGNQGSFLAYTHIGHDCIIGDHVVFSNNATLGGHVEIEDHVILGGLTGIHQFCRIGAHAITGGFTKIVQDVPPFMVADGNPARTRAVNKVGLDRRGFSDESKKAIKFAYRTLFREERNVTEAVEVLRGMEGRTEEVDLIIAFVEKSERGLH